MTTTNDPRQQPSGLQRGDVIRVADWHGESLERRVWSQVGDGVQVCSEQDYQRAVKLGEEPLYADFPLTAIVP